MVCLSRFGSAQDVSVRLRKTFLGSASPSILPLLLLPLESLALGLDGLKHPSHSAWSLPVGRAGLSPATLGKDQADV